MNLTFSREKIIKNGCLLLMSIVLLTGCSADGSTSGASAAEGKLEEAEPYFGLEFPSRTVTRFAPKIFKNEMHSSPIFMPDGREVYWSLMHEPRGVRCMKIENGFWTEPAPASFDRVKQGDSPFISSDGKHLLYLGRSISGDEVIRQVDRENDEWGSPRTLPDQVNQNGAHWQASLADNGNLYFGSEGHIFFSKFENGSYLTAEELDLNDGVENGYVGSPFISPDESYLIYDVAGRSYADLYIAFREGDGDWGEPVPLEAINSDAHDLYANVSPDGRFIMFLSSRSGILLPYWVDAGIIEDYRPSK